jgi:hypothetical protein
MVFAHTNVDAPKNGARSRAAPISVPRLAAPTTNTSSPTTVVDVLASGPPCGTAAGGVAIIAI